MGKVFLFHDKNTMLCFCYPQYRIYVFEITLNCLATIERAMCFLAHDFFGRAPFILQ